MDDRGKFHHTYFVRADAWRASNRARAKHSLNRRPELTMIVECNSCSPVDLLDWSSDVGAESTGTGQTCKRSA